MFHSISYDMTDIMQNLWRSTVHGQFSYHSVAELIARIPSKLSHKVELAVSIVANAILAMSQYQMAFWQLSSNIMQRWQINSTETHLPTSETPKSKHSRLHLVCQERLHWNFRITNNCCCYLRANREEILAMSTLQKVIFSGKKTLWKVQIVRKMAIAHAYCFTHMKFCS